MRRRPPESRHRAKPALSGALAALPPAVPPRVGRGPRRARAGPASRRPRKGRSVASHETPKAALSIGEHLIVSARRPHVPIGHPSAQSDDATALTIAFFPSSSPCNPRTPPEGLRLAAPARRRRVPRRLPGRGPAVAKYMGKLGSCSSASGDVCRRARAVAPPLCDQRSPATISSRVARPRSVAVRRAIATAYPIADRSASGPALGGTIGNYLPGTRAPCCARSRRGSASDSPAGSVSAS